jgi:hypothetical protein
MAENPSIKRRLVAILAADIAGYSRLMHQDEATTVRDLKTHRASDNPTLRKEFQRIADGARKAGSPEK